MLACNATSNRRLPTYFPLAFVPATLGSNSSESDKIRGQKRAVMASFIPPDSVKLPAWKLPLVYPFPLSSSNNGHAPTANGSSNTECGGWNDIRILVVGSSPIPPKPHATPGSKSSIPKSVQPNIPLVAAASPTSATTPTSTYAALSKSAASTIALLRYSSSFVRKSASFLRVFLIALDASVCELVAACEKSCEHAVASGSVRDDSTARSLANNNDALLIDDDPPELFNS